MSFASWLDLLAVRFFRTARRERKCQTDPPGARPGPWKPLILQEYPSSAADRSCEQVVSIRSPLTQYRAPLAHPARVILGLGAALRTALPQQQLNRASRDEPVA